MSQIITNVNAPQIKITIDADFRYNPPALTVNCSQTVPALTVQAVLMTCALNLNAMMQQAEAGKMKPKAEALPDLPPAPQTN